MPWGAISGHQLDFLHSHSFCNYVRVDGTASRYPDMAFNTVASSEMGFTAQGMRYRWSVLHTLQRYINLLQSTGHVMHQQFNIQQLYVLPTHCICFVFI